MKPLVSFFVLALAGCGPMSLQEWSATYARVLVYQAGTSDRWEVLVNLGGEGGNCRGLGEVTAQVNGVELTRSPTRKSEFGPSIAYIPPSTFRQSGGSCSISSPQFSATLDRTQLGERGTLDVRISDDTAAFRQLTFGAVELRELRRQDSGPVDAGEAVAFTLTPKPEVPWHASVTDQADSGRREGLFARADGGTLEVHAPESRGVHRLEATVVLNPPVGVCEGVRLDCRTSVISVTEHTLTVR